MGRCGRKGSGYIALYSQHPAHWPEDESYRDVELRAEAHDNIWICEMGDAGSYGDFEHFVDAISSAPVHCEGLKVRYHSPSLGEMSFGWTEPLCAGGKQVELHNYPRFDNPYCQAEVGERCYVIMHGDDPLVLDFR